MECVQESQPFLEIRQKKDINLSTKIKKTTFVVLSLMDSKSSKSFIYEASDSPIREIKRNLNILNKISSDGRNLIFR